MIVPSGSFRASSSTLTVTENWALTPAIEPRMIVAGDGCAAAAGRTPGVWRLSADL